MDANQKLWYNFFKTVDALSNERIKNWFGELVLVSVWISQINFWLIIPRSNIQFYRINVANGFVRSHFLNIAILLVGWEPLSLDCIRMQKLNEYFQKRSEFQTYIWPTIS